MKTCSEQVVAGSMGGNLRQPTKLVDVKPRYPAELAEAGIGGVFVFAARIGTDGTISDLQTTSGSNPDLELAAANAIRQWEFTPTLLNCVAIEVPMTVRVSFVTQ
jgi:TonB family protein